MEDEVHTLRILVASDLHLGFMEKDEIRRHDSFNTFDEICALASKHQVDLVLLGGDIFHENKPSRATLVRTIEILRRYCLNDRPVEFQVVSDQTVNFPNIFGHVNYEDPHYNVGLPVFTIHGNHDDPAGVDNLSAIDILSACNLVNYFGKTILGGSGVGQITLHPILLRKGSTKVALYGLGNIRDERLNRMFQTPHAVQWIRPENQEGCPTSDWFNIFVLHQNRVKTNPKNAINEHFLARFLDLVVWGHEHECLIDPQEVSGMGFHLTQPGSSIATSLTDGEAKPKHVLLIEIKGSQYRPTKIPLQTVRPFEFADVSLMDEPDLDPNDQVAVTDYLGKVVQDLIARAPGKAAGCPELMIPLVRLRVDYTGFTTINPQRFGQKFVGKVANPHDILLLTRASRRRQLADGKVQESDLLQPEELNQQNIEALVAESNPKMEILPVTDLGMALHDFVSKDDKQAFYSCVQHNLGETQNKLIQEGEAETINEEKDVVEKVIRHMQQREVDKSSHKRASGVSDSQLPWSQGQTGQFVNQKHAGKTQSLSASGLVGESLLGTTGISDEDDGFGEGVGITKVAEQGGNRAMQAPSSAGRVTPSRGRGRGRGRGGRSLKQTTLDAPLQPHSQRAGAVSASLRSISIDEDSDAKAEESEDELEEPDSDSEPVRLSKISRGRKRPAPAGSQRGRRASSGQQSTPKRGRKVMNTVTTRQSYVDDDDDEDDDVATRSGRGQTPPIRRSWGSLRR
ncbi:hypothetical protein O6H91_12G043300 [Diphasiastrum complanatum]|uniref:Uncharacterized protein n=2 Tax=Diphasiastrum complanatum TaxID=34168 RepID=A0ACC2C135_DIPCM|nr:hypothetical protein O6H91_12G043300 [Diphasiastrum complanatum]